MEGERNVLRKNNASLLQEVNFISVATFFATRLDVFPGGRARIEIPSFQADSLAMYSHGLNGNLFTLSDYRQKHPAFFVSIPPSILHPPHPSVIFFPTHPSFAEFVPLPFSLASALPPNPLLT